VRAAVIWLRLQHEIDHVCNFLVVRAARAARAKLIMKAGLTKSPVEAGDQGACPSADPSSFVPSQDGPRSSAPFAGPHLDLEAALIMKASDSLV
jgi:hypothetical protein